MIPPSFNEPLILFIFYRSILAILNPFESVFNAMEGYINCFQSCAYFSEKVFNNRRYWIG